MITQQPLTHALLDAPGVWAAIQDTVERRPPDVVFAYCSGMAKFALQPPLDRVPLVLDFVDIDSQKWRDLAAESRWPHSWIYRREAATLGAFEARAAAHAAAALVVNKREADLARALAPAATIQVLSNGVELERLRPLGPPAAGARIVFCGVMDYAPNDEGMQWFVREVWPLVRERRSDATLAIVGRGATPALRSLCENDASIAVTGRVKDVRDWLWESAVGIAPLRVARGVQNKALEAIAAGLPIVLTDAVAGGLPPQAMPASRVANTPQAFAEQVVDLLRLSPADRRAMAASANLSELTWSQTLAPLWSILERAAGCSHCCRESAVAQIAWRSA
jgi:polysaccharide biosynthesis protein PslH